MITAFLVMMLAQAPQAPVPQMTPSPAQPSGSSDYVVGRGDVLNISVVGTDVFNANKVNVDNDGKFQYLEIGRVDASGLTITQIAKEIHDLLGPNGRNLYASPTVLVDVSDFRSQTVYINGAVRDPRSFTIKGNTTLMMVLAAAGFTTSTGATVTVTRRKNPFDTTEKANEFKFLRKDLESGMHQDFVLQDGDVIHVSEAEKCFVSGEVHNTGTYDVTSGNLTVNQVLTLAGGLTERGSKNRIKIQRIVDGKTVLIKVDKDLSTIVLPGDTVIVGRRVM